MRLYAFMPMFADIDKGNAYLVLGIPKKAVFANIDCSLTTNAVFLGIVFFLTFAAAWFGSERFILRKVKTIIETTRRLAAGDLNARTGRPYGKGELSQLARAFDETADSLQIRQAEIIKVNEGLRKERDFSRTLIQSSSAFFVAISAEGKTIMMNDSMLRALGYTLDEIVGTNYLTTFVPASDHELLSSIFKQLIELRQPTVNENRLLVRDGRELLVEWHGAPVFKENGDFDYFFGVGIDITERKRIEEQLRSSREQLRDLAANMRAAIEEEKKLISREIHDELGQVLTGLKHEKWDGTGYPHGLKGEQIPLSARIFALVDVWDALRSPRPYRPAWAEDKVKEYIQDQAGKHFDPKVVEVFFKMEWQSLEEV